MSPVDDTGLEREVDVETAEEELADVSTAALVEVAELPPDPQPTIATATARQPAVTATM